MYLMLIRFIDHLSIIKIKEKVICDNRFIDHPSIIKIKEKVICDNKFTFMFNSLDRIKICINQLNTTKPTTYNNKFSDVSSNPGNKLYNESTLQGSAPNAMKLADTTTSHKKYDKCLKENYRPISILSSFSKNLRNYNIYLPVHGKYIIVIPTRISERLFYTVLSCGNVGKVILHNTVYTVW